MSHLFGGQLLFHAQSLGQQGIDAVCQNDDIRIHDLAAGINTDYLAVLDNTAVNTDSGDKHNARLFAFLGHPLVKFGTKDGIGRAVRIRTEISGAVADIQRALFCHQRNLFLRDQTLHRSFLCKAGENLLHAVGIETSARHVFGTTVITAVRQKDLHPGVCQNIRSGCARHSASYDYGVKFFFAHSFSPFFKLQAAMFPEPAQ